MKSEKEVREMIERLEENRRWYLRHRRATDYSRKIYHYIRALRWVIGELDENKLGIAESLLKTFNVSKRKGTLEDTIRLIKEKKSTLGFSEDTIRVAIDLARKFRELSNSYYWKSLAAGALYVAQFLLFVPPCEMRTQREIAEVIGCTEVTLRNTYKAICSQLGLWRRSRPRSSVLTRLMFLNRKAYM